MAKIIEGALQAKGLKMGIVVSRFNDFITSKLLEGSIDVLIRHGASDKDIEVVKVPGAFEIPFAAKLMVQKGSYDAVICLGAVIRGATPHFDYISAEATKGIGVIAMQSPIPVLYGVLTTDTIEQAIERAGTKAGNKGAEVTLGAIEMVNLCKQLGK
jgi:6,7-dimethyl-8-ribityllumazine synthase